MAYIYFYWPGYLLERMDTMNYKAIFCDCSD